MKLEIDMPEHHYNNIMAFDSMSLGRVPYKGIIMYAINAIKHGKVLEQEPRWIPVSERLPEPFEFVNCTCHSLIDDREDWVVETIYLPIPKEANKHGYSDWGNIPMLNSCECEVVAWMYRDIPKPYKAESENP